MARSRSSGGQGLGFFTENLLDLGSGLVIFKAGLFRWMPQRVKL